MRVAPSSVTVRQPHGVPAGSIASGEAGPSHRRLGERGTPWALAVVALALRVPFFSRYPTEWDSVQLVMGLDRFDVQLGSPHAPGYWLYVAAGRTVRVLTPLDSHQSMLVLAALASAGAVALTYLAGRELAGPFLGLGAAGFLLVCPYLWFYGSMVNVYVFDALTVSALVLCALRARPGSRHGLAAAAVLGLGAGFRPTTLFLLGPLALVAAGRSVRSLRGALATVVVGGLAVAGWAVPMSLEQPGGFGAIRRESRSLWEGSAAQTTVFSDRYPERVHNNLVGTTAETLAALGPLLPLFGVGGLLALAGWLRRRRDGERPPPEGVPVALGAGVLAAAILPAVAFNYLVHFGKSGYLLIFLPAAVLGLCWPASRIGRPGPHRLASRALLGALLVLAGGLAAQRFVFGEGVLPRRWLDGSLEITQARFGAPYRMTASAIAATDEEVDRYREVGRVLDPRRDVLVFSWLNGAHRLRHAMWTMPDFWVALLTDGRHVSTGRHRVWWPESDQRLEVPEGGRAVFVFDAPPPEVAELVRTGRAAPLPLSTGPTVWVVPPGVSLLGITVAEVPPAEMGPQSRSG